MALAMPSSTCSSGAWRATALTTCGCRVLPHRALPVVTSARREAHAPHSFSRYLAELDGATA